MASAALAAGLDNATTVIIAAERRIMGLIMAFGPLMEQVIDRPLVA
ncbi:hypothetical protein C8D88_107234 [Lentzea atacamensis]|uniref:Uncharacterized protein n=1 Tax=Lentzea atacamensis TaxID=531938 RepID=A0A316HUY5_9PSEU|nr:hypothetical protein [Lentzea atacamensis]PWK85027.1 hypothetical protein C8D88_107234 [Lentzea atacamensis]